MTLTRNELIEALEKHLEETQGDIDASKQALAALRSVGRRREGPIVYGSKVKTVKTITTKKSKRNSRTPGVSREAIFAILRANPQGQTLKQLQEKLRDGTGISLKTGGIYSALRGTKLKKHTSGEGNQIAYSL